MAFTTPSPVVGGKDPKRSLNFMENAIKRKHSFIQFFAMTGILLLSLRSLGQKYRLYELEEDNFALREEKQALADRMKRIKSDLRAEAALEPTGAFASRLRVLIGDDE